MFSFFGIMLVLFIHASYPEADAPVFRRISFFISQGIGSLFCPLFFCISGYLFFHNLTDIGGIPRKLWRRVSSLLIPYLLVNLLAYIMLGILKIIPACASFVNARCYLGDGEYGFRETIYQLFVTPYMFHLWFLKTLMVVMLFTPLLFCILRRKWTGGILVTLLLAAGAFNFRLKELDYVREFLHIVPDFWYALGYFSFGGYAALNKFDIERQRSWKETLVLVFSGIFSGVLLYLLFSRLPGIWYLLLFIILWELYDVFKLSSYSGGKILNFVIPYSFFIYLFHEPWLNVPKKILVRLFPGVTGYYLGYFLSPLLTAFILVLAAFFLEKYASVFYGIITGNRGVKKKFTVEG